MKTLGLITLIVMLVLIALVVTSWICEQLEEEMLQKRVGMRSWIILGQDVYMAKTDRQVIKYPDCKNILEYVGIFSAIDIEPIIIGEGQRVACYDLVVTEGDGWIRYEERGVRGGVPYTKTWGTFERSGR